ncbi:MAG: substrate-binding domain-containing protein, partial [Novibacillus thermophilus]
RIPGPLTHPVTGFPRYQGYREALEAKGVPFDEKYVRVGDYRYQSGMEAMRELLALDEPPTAVFAASDEMAVGVIHAVQDAGKRVPEDISVIGFDNINISSMVRPLLSTIAQPMYDIGAVSMRLLTKLMNKEEVEDPHVILQHELVLRQSTKTQAGE